MEKRNPLAASAARAGWVGCNILLNNIPADERITMVEGGKPVAKQIVRDSYERLRPLEELNVEKRGWTLDVLQAIRGLGKREFALSEIYFHADELTKLHPNNFHVRDKIRQQLQVLRDLNLLEFLRGGVYRLR